MAANGERRAGTPRRWSLLITWKPSRPGTDGLQEIMWPVMRFLGWLDSNGERHIVVRIGQLNDWPDDDVPPDDTPT